MREFLSTNGRWGVQIIGLPEGDGSIFEGRFESLGKRGGMTCFRFVPEAGKFVGIFGDASPITGAIEVFQESLQSSDVVTLMALSEGAIVQTFGYKGRSSEFKGLRGGELVSVPAVVLLDIGAIDPAEGSIIEIPEAPTSGANWELVED